MASSTTTVLGVTTVYTARPVLGPLTTVFTPPPECTFAAVRGTPLKIGFRAQTCDGDTLADASTCWPEAVAAAPSPTTPFHGWGFYSPGFSCPAGHTTACEATQGQFAGWATQYALEVGETADGCCPSGFTCARFGSAQTCVLTASESILTASCSGGNFVSSGFGTFPITYTSTNAENTSTATLSSLLIAAPMIQINWRSQDRMDATQALPTPTGTGGSSTPASSSSISAGALAGAVIAGVVILFAIAMAIFTLMRCRTARVHSHAQLTSDIMISSRHHNQEVVSSASELSSGYVPPEMSQDRDPRELSAYQSPIELPGSLHGPHAVQRHS